MNTYLHYGRMKLGVVSPAQTVLRMQQLGWMVRPVAPEEPEPPLSGVWRAYLRAFEKYLHSHRDETVEGRARMEMRWLHGAGHIDDGRPVPRGRDHGMGGTDRLIRITTRQEGTLG